MDGWDVRPPASVASVFGCADPRHNLGLEGQIQKDPTPSHLSASMRAHTKLCMRLEPGWHAHRSMEHVSSNAPSQWEEPRPHGLHEVRTTLGTPCGLSPIVLDLPKLDQLGVRICQPAKQKAGAIES